MIKYYYTFIITKGQINYYENSFYKIDKIYFRNRKLHRDNGPACEWSDGEIAWFKDDIPMAIKSGGKRECL